VRAANAQRSAVSSIIRNICDCTPSSGPPCLIALIWASAFGQATSTDSLELNRRNPDGWFTVNLPKVIAKVERIADVAGGFYVSDILGVHYDYWTYPNTPNWLRGKDATSLLLACSGQSNHNRILRTWIDGHRAVIQQCSETDGRKGFRYIYYVTFPKLKIFDGEKFRYGMFNFTVEYKLRRHSTLAERIVHSLDFEANAPPNKALQLTAR
jgi:hypothetical protein